MASPVNTLLKQALLTFGGVKDKFPHNLEQLRRILDRITATDVGFKGHDLLLSETWKDPGKAPVTYVNIFEDNLVTMGVFVLKPGMKLPLHDHPQMYGLIKVIAGSVQISSYSINSVNPDRSIDAEQHKPVTVQDADGCCLLEPLKENLHEIESVGGVAAFLDVLSPPYEVQIPGMGPRKCTYFMPLLKKGPDNLLLTVMDSPSWFWTDTYPYVGPEIIDEATVDTQESEGR